MIDTTDRKIGEIKCEFCEWSVMLIHSKGFDLKEALRIDSIYLWRHLWKEHKEELIWS